MNAFNTFPGLRPFQSEEDYLFFGREEQISELMKLLREHRFLAVVGSSGSGKSSLVRCGLLSQLQGGMMLDAGSDWHIAVMQPGGDPLSNLAQSLLDADIYDEDDEDTVHQVMATINRSTNGLVEAVKQSELPTGSNMLIVVDQFEEIFRFHEAGNKGQQQAPDFIRWLIHAVQQDDVPIYVVLTMRSDFLGDCARFTGLAEAINHGEYLVPKLTRDQVQQAIEGPVKVAGGEVSRRLIQRLLNDVGEHADQLPVLQHSLMRSWDHCHQRAADTAPQMDLEDYEAVGGMTDALSNHADEILLEIQESVGDSTTVLNATERVFRALTEKGVDNRGIRRPTRLDLLRQITGASTELLNTIIEAYRAPGRTFLMPFSNTPLDDGMVIDISHESLMRVWKRLKTWVEEESQSVRIYKRLSETAILWKQNHAGLYRDPDLQIALSWLETANPNEAWAARYDTNFPVAVEFLEASDRDQHEAARVAEENRQRELRQAQELAESQERLAQEQTASARKFKRQSRITGAVAAVAIVASILAMLAMAQARKNEKLANRATAEAVESKKQLTLSYRRESILAAQEAFDADNLAECLNVLQTAYQRDTTDNDLLRSAISYLSQKHLFHPYRTEPDQHSVTQCFELPSIQAVAYVNGNHQVHVVPHPGTATTDNPPAVQFNAQSQIAALTANEKHVGVLEQDGRVLLVQRDNGNVTNVSELFADTPNFPQPAALDQVSLVDNRVLLSAGNRAVLISHQDTPSIVAEIELPDTAEITHACLSSDGQTVFLVTAEDGYQLYDAADPAQPVRTVANDSDVQLIQFLPMQRQFLTIEEDGQLCLTSAEDESLDTVHAVTIPGIRRALVSPEGTRLAILDPAGVLAMHSLIDGRPILLPQLPADLRMDDFIFDPLGLFLIATDQQQRPLVLRADDGHALAAPLPIQVSSGGLLADWEPVESGPWDGQKTLTLRVARSDISAGQPNVGIVQLRATAPLAQNHLPNWEQFDLTDIGAEDGNLFFLYFQSLLSAKPSPAYQPTHPALQAFQNWFERHSAARQVDFIQPNDNLPALTEHLAQAGQFYDSEVASDQPIDLALALVARQITPRVLSQAMKLSTDATTSAAATRYHQIKLIQQHYEYPQTPEFALAMLQHMARLPQLLEIRSQAYTDQSHESDPVDLTSPELISEWDGLADWWEAKDSGVSLLEERKWAATNNQYVTWIGGHFADFRIQVEIAKLFGNSGFDGRTHFAPDTSNVYQANYLHPYLRQGYQADLVGSQNLNVGNFHGKFINDNYPRPLVIADRGQAVLIGIDHKPVALARSQTESSLDLLQKMQDLPEGSKITLEMRGNHLRFSYGDLLLNNIFDSQPGRDMSGEFAIQAMGTNSQLTFKNMVVVPLGRDIAEAEMAATPDLVVPSLLHAQLLTAQKRWYDLYPVLDANAAEPWTQSLRRTANLATQRTHQKLAQAAMQNDAETLQSVIDEINDAELLNEIANTDAGSTGYGNQFATPVLAAALHGSTDALQLLADSGVDLKKQTGIYGMDALKAACFGNHVETAKLLLALGSDPNGSNFSGYRPIHEAAKWGGPELTQLLLDAGATATQITRAGRNPLQELAEIRSTAKQFGDNHFAQFAVSERRLQVARVLIAAGLDPRARIDNRRSAIQLAKNRGDTELVELLEELSQDQANTSEDDTE